MSSPSIRFGYLLSTELFLWSLCRLCLWMLIKKNKLKLIFFLHSQQHFSPHRSPLLKSRADSDQWNSTDLGNGAKSPHVSSIRPHKEWGITCPIMPRKKVATSGSNTHQLCSPEPLKSACLGLTWKWPLTVIVQASRTTAQRNSIYMRSVFSL